MLIVKRDNAANPVKIALSGVVDETTDFLSSIGKQSNSFDVYCREVTRINSVGIKLWREYFGKLRTSNTTLRFFELSPPLVATVNYISDFISNKEIHSVLAPFHCSNCNHTSLKLFTTDELKSSSADLPKIQCDKCKGPAEFDEIPDEFFSFLK